MRYLCLLAALLMLPVTATAQQRPSSDERRSNDRRAERSDRSDKSDQSDRSDRSGRSDHRRSSTNDDRSNTGLTRLGLPPAPASRVPAWEQRQTPWWERQGPPVWEQRQQMPGSSWARDLKEQQDRRLGKPTPRRHDQPAVVYVLPPYRYFPNNSIYTYGVSSSTTFIAPPPPNVVTMAPPEAQPPITTGFLKLEVEPRDLLQVFVDGLYVGTLADLGDEIELRLGARRIELRAQGYRTLIFDTEIVADRTVVYRGALEPVSNAPASPAPAPPVTIRPSATPASRTMYVIPGCYLGNVAPKASDLRAGCDLKNLSKIEP